MQNPEQQLNRIFNPTVPSSEKGLRTERYKKLEEKYNLISQAKVKSNIREVFRNSLTKYHEGDKTGIADAAKELRHYGKIFIDVNGLKAVNDWVSHKHGDILLDRIADCLRNNNNINSFINKYQLNCEIGREGGDEFSLIIESVGDADDRAEEVKDRLVNDIVDSEDAPAIEEENGGSSDNRKWTILERLREIILEEISQIDISDLIDFSNPEIYSKLSEEGKKLLEKAGKDDYKFFASAAAGECYFEEVFTKYLKQLSSMKGEEKRAKERLLDDWMGGVQKLASEREKWNKEAYKKMLADSDDPKNKFTAYLLARTESERSLLAENMELKDREKIFFELSNRYREYGKRLRKGETLNPEEIGEMERIEERLEELEAA